MRTAIKLIWLPLLVVLGACGNSPPEIMNLHWQLNMTAPSAEEQWLSREELSLFVLASDEDGPDEVEFLYIIQEEEELFWQLNGDIWEIQTLGSDEWLGASSLRMPGGETFPRKTYKLLVVDKSGRRSERDFFLSPKSPEDPDFPAGRVEEGVLILDSPHKVHTLRIYNSQGILVQELKTESREINLKKIISEDQESEGTGEGYQIILTANLDSQGITLRTNPIPYSETVPPTDQSP